MFELPIWLNKKDIVKVRKTRYVPVPRLIVRFGVLQCVMDYQIRKLNMYPMQFPEYPAFLVTIPQATKLYESLHR